VTEEGEKKKGTGSGREWRR